MPLYDKAIGLAIPFGIFPYQIWLQPRLIISTGLSGDFQCGWEGKAHFDFQSKKGIALTNGEWKRVDYNKPYCFTPGGSGGYTKKEFALEVPLKIRLIYDIYLVDPDCINTVRNLAYGVNNSDFESYVGPYAELEADLWLHGLSDRFRVGAQFHGSLGCDLGEALDNFSASTGLAVLHPISFPFPIGDPSYKLYETPYTSPLGPTVPMVQKPGDTTGPSHRPSYRRRRRHHATSKYKHLNEDISIQIRNGAEILKNRGWHDDLGLNRDDQIDHVTIKNSQEGLVAQGIRSISGDNQGSSDNLKASATHHFVKLYDAGNSLLAVRNRIADVGFRRASNGNRIRLLRRVRSYTRELRHSNRAIDLLKSHISSEKEQPSIQPGQEANPSTPPTPK